MATFMKKVAAFLRGHNFVFHRRYDNACAVYEPGNTESPKYSYAVKGEFRISLLRMIALFFSALTFLATCKAVTCGKRGRKKKIK